VQMVVVLLKRKNCGLSKYTPTRRAFRCAGRSVDFSKLLRGPW